MSFLLDVDEKCGGCQWEICEFRYYYDLLEHEGKYVDLDHHFY